MDREAPRRVIRLSALAKARVESEGGRALGRLVDLRAGSDGRGRERASVSGLVCGALGWLERLGLRAPGGRRIAWGRVLRMDERRIVVRERAAAEDGD